MPMPPAFRNAMCWLDMPFRTPATPTVSSGLPQSFPDMATPACSVASMSVKSQASTLGLAHPVYTPRIKSTAAAISIMIFVGYISIPAAVLTGIVHL